MKKWLIFVLAWFWLPASAYAVEYYYLFVKTTQASPTEDDLARVAHVVFQQGVRANRPQRYDDEHRARNFFTWLTVDAEENFVVLHPNVESIVQGLRIPQEPVSGLILEVSPDMRAFNFRRTVENLRRIIPNQGPARGPMNRLLSQLSSDLSNAMMVGGMPVPLAPGEDAAIMIRPQNIRRAIIIRNGLLGRQVGRDVNQEGPFIPAPFTSSWLGYPDFGQPTDPFPEEGFISVIRGTDNATSVQGGACYNPLRTIRSAGLDRNDSREKTCKKSELIDFAEFDTRHRRHRASIAPLTFLLLQ